MKLIHEKFSSAGLSGKKEKEDFANEDTYFVVFSNLLCIYKDSIWKLLGKILDQSELNGCGAHNFASLESHEHLLMAVTAANIMLRPTSYAGCAPLDMYQLTRDSLNDVTASASALQDVLAKSKAQMHQNHMQMLSLSKNKEESASKIRSLEVSCVRYELQQLILQIVRYLTNSQFSWNFCRRS